MPEATDASTRSHRSSQHLRSASAAQVLRGDGAHRARAPLHRGLHGLGTSRRASRTSPSASRHRSRHSGRRRDGLVDLNLGLKRAARDSRPLAPSASAGRVTADSLVGGSLELSSLSGSGRSRFRPSRPQVPRAVGARARRFRRYGPASGAHGSRAGTRSGWLLRIEDHLKSERHR